MDPNLLLAFVALGALIATFHFLRLRHDAQDQRTLQEAIRADSPLVPELFAQMRDRPRRRSLTTGLVLLAIAAAMLLAGVIRGGEENIRGAAAAAVFPAMVGLVVWLRARRKKPGA